MLDIKSIIGRLYYYTYLRRIFKSERAPLPRQISLEITWDCNLNCFMCPRLRGQPLNLKHKSLPLAEFKEIIKKNREIKKINFIGAGEPLIHPDFYDMLKIANMKGIKVTFTTNGILLSEERIRKLPRNVKAIYFSIDSPVPEIYKAIRGVDINIVLNNMQTLRKLRKDVKIHIQALLMRKTLNKLGGLISIARKLNAEISFINLIAFDEELDKLHISNVEEYPKYYQELSQELGGRHTLIRPPYPVKIDCTDPWLCPMVSVTGDIYPCCYIYEARGGFQTFREYLKGVSIEVPMYQYRIGNIFQQTLAEVWNSKPLRLLRRTIIKSSTINVNSYEELNKLRKTIDLTERYAYCKVCLYRWSCAC